MYFTETQLRVRYGETDQMSYAYYGNYAMYYEVARADLVRELGYTYREMEDDGYLMPVVELNIRFRQPAYYDDLLTIKTFIKDKPGRKITFHHEVYNELNELLNQGHVTLFFVKKGTGKICSPPERFAEVINRYF